MKKVCIKIIGIPCNKSDILIFTENKEMIYQENTNIIKVSLKENKGYFLIINYHNIIVKKKIYIDCHTNCITLNLYNLINTPKKIIFHLKDYNYPNLPIEKGEMIVWQKQLTS